MSGELTTPSASAIKERIDAVIADMATTLETTRRAIAEIEAIAAGLRTPSATPAAGAPRHDRN